MRKHEIIFLGFYLAQIVLELIRDGVEHDGPLWATGKALESFVIYYVPETIKHEHGQSKDILW